MLYKENSCDLHCYLFTIIISECTFIKYAYTSIRSSHLVFFVIAGAPEDLANEYMFF